MSLRRATLSMLSLLALSCAQEAEKQVEAPPAPTPPPVVEAPKADPRCLGPVAAGPATPVTLKGVNWELAGSTLSQKSPAAGDTLTIGAITDIKEDTPENVENLKTFAKWFTEKKVDLVVVAGDTGETAAQIQNNLAILAALEVPVLNIAGNRESRKEYAAAMEALRAKHPNVFDLNTVRRVDTPLLDLVSMPGYFNANYIHAEDGCHYTAADVATLAQAVKGADSPLMLISHGGPKQDGPEAIDRTSEGDNVGDPQLTKAITELKIPFGIFGNIHEAGGRGTDLAGKLVKPETPSDSLFLHPGAADSVRWVLNDKSEAVGMAAVVTVKTTAGAAKASYVVNRLPDPEKLAKKGKKK